LEKRFKRVGGGDKEVGQEEGMDDLRVGWSGFLRMEISPIGAAEVEEGVEG